MNIYICLHIWWTGGASSYILFSQGILLYALDTNLTKLLAYLYIRNLYIIILPIGMCNCISIKFISIMITYNISNHILQYSTN